MSIESSGTAIRDGAIGRCVLFLKEGDRVDPALSFF